MLNLTLLPFTSDRASSIEVAPLPFLGNLFTLDISFSFKQL